MIARRSLWMAGGWLALASGAVGVVLPLWPSTVFLLLAAYCFSRGSERLHAWLLAHPTFGRPILEWQEHGAISRSGKIAAAVAMLAALAIAWAFGVAPWLLGLQAAILAAVALFLFTRPEPPKQG